MKFYQEKQEHYLYDHTVDLYSAGRTVLWMFEGDDFDKNDEKEEDEKKEENDEKQPKKVIFSIDPRYPVVVSFLVKKIFFYANTLP